MPTSPSFPEIGTSSHLPISSPVQHAKSEMDGIFEGTKEAAEVKAVHTEVGGVHVIEEERRGPS